MSAVLTTPPAKKFTPDDLLRLPDEGKGYELVDGELKELNVSTLSMLAASEIYGQLRDHVKPRRLGWCFADGQSYRCFPNDGSKVRRPDASFIRLDRMSADQARQEGHCIIVPDLIVEVISPNDLASEVNEKRTEWLKAGVQLVWVVDPVLQIVQAFLADGTIRELRQTDMLTAEPVLPEFRVPVADLFKLPTDA